MMNQIQFDISEQSELKVLLTDAIQYYNYMKVKMLVNGTNVGVMDNRIENAQYLIDKLNELP